MLLDVLGLPCLTQAFGIITAFRGISALVGPPSAGFVVEKFANPGLALLMSGVLFASSTGVDSLACMIHNVWRRRNNYIEIP